MIPVAKAELFESLAKVGKALGSGKRLELVDLLAQGNAASMPSPKPRD